MVIEEDVYQNYVENKLSRISQDARVEFVKKIVGRLHRFWHAFDPADLDFSEAVRLVMDPNVKPHELKAIDKIIGPMVDRASVSYEETNRAALKNAFRQGVIAHQAKEAAGALGHAIYVLLDEDASLSASFAAMQAWLATLSDPAERELQEQHLDELLERFSYCEEVKILNLVKKRLRGQKLDIVANKTEIEANESELGFSLPSTLKQMLLEVGNGGFGPGYGLIGVRKGHQSEFGGLSSTYHRIKADRQSKKENWPYKLLPFNEWGGGIFSCVNCENNQVFLLYNLELFDQRFSLEEFYDIWINGDNDLLLRTSDGQQLAVKIDHATGKTLIAPD